jgi:hypothetical protein
LAKGASLAAGSCRLALACIRIHACCIRKIISDDSAVMSSAAATVPMEMLGKSSVTAGHGDEKSRSQAT